MLILLHIFNMMEEIFKVYQMIKYLSTQYGSNRTQYLAW